MQITRTISMIGFVATVALCTSCGGPARKPLHPTSGKVMYKKTTPAEGVLVIFTPANDADAAKNWPEGFPRATTEKDGVFTLTTYQRGDGIPAGDYIVTMMWTPPQPDDHERETPDKLGGRYSDAKKSPYRVTITPGENQLPVFEVK